LSEDRATGAISQFYLSAGYAVPHRKVEFLEIWDAIGYILFLIKDTTVSKRNPVRAYSNKVDEKDLSNL
jgi:hypothetical protein